MVTYKTSGVCAKEINFKIENGKLRDVSFLGGCDGNLKGISKLVEGMEATDVISRLTGVRCGSRKTSCPDQLANALKQIVEL